ncbi:MAG TPA: nucleotidyltransferase family protein, partial [Pirellulales bacterium]|nr:nucleotidyltransferase family protein [Pirellulales bacterium]
HAILMALPSAARMAMLREVSWERMIRAVEKVRDRLLRAARALEAAGVPYAVVGGNAVAAWVSRVDELAVRNTRDVDILLARADLQRATAALAAAGFVYRHVKSIDMFLDGPEAKARDAVHILFAGEKVRDDSLFAAPEITESEPGDQFMVVKLEALVRMKLTSYRDRDRTHLRDLIDVELIDRSWLARLPAELASRLQYLLDNPE